MDEIKNNAALEAEQTTALAPAAPAEEPEEESLVLKFRKPYKFEGVEYTEVDLSAMEDMTAADLCAVGKIMNKLGIVNPVAEMTVDYAIYMAARASGKPVEFFQGLPPKESIKLKNMVTENKTLPQSAVRDLIVALITLKYTQSNSVCYAVDGQAIGVGAGQQSRIHCTRLAGGKADTWHLRQHEKVLSLPFLPTLGRPDRDNVIDGYINHNEEDVCADGVWQRYFTTRPEPFLPEEQKAYLSQITGVALGSDAFFPFDDNIERAHRSGVSYIAQPGGSIRDDLVIDCCNKYGIAMAFTGMRLFHH